MPSPSPSNGSPQNSAPQEDTSKRPSTPTTPSPSDPPPSPSRYHRTIHIHLSDIETPDSLNGRLELDEKQISELTHLIARDGLLNPILVRAIGDRYELIAGNHRLAAMRRLKWDQTPALLIDANDYETGRLRLLENVARTNLSPVEEAKQLSRLVETHPNGVDGVAIDIHRRPDWILDRLEIVSYPESLLRHVHSKRISLAAAKYLARNPDHMLRESNIHFAATDGCTAKMARAWLHDAAAEALPPPEPSENSSFIVGEQFETHTLARCFVCREQYNLEDTRAERLCTNCLRSIETSWQTAQTAPVQPANPSPGPAETTPDPTPEHHVDQPIEPPNQPATK